jgi:hypothetical protein
MNHSFKAVAILAIMAGLLCSSFLHRHGKTTDAALRFINELSAEQKKQAMFDFADAERTTWTFLPAQNRRGLPLKQIDERQERLLFEFLGLHLSEMGYKKTKDIIGLEQVLFELEGHKKRDKELYFICFFGDPAKDKTWGWSFEGHHISLNFTIVDGHISTTPRFLGSNPAEVKQGRHKGLRVLKDEEDLGLKLIQSMNEKQQSKAIVSDKTYGEIVTAMASKVDHLGDKGLPVSKFSPDQKKLLQKLLDVYIYYMAEDLAQKRSKQINEAGIDNLIFAWAGATTRGKAHYYRIQGKTFLIEFDNSQNNANHIHTVWRDFDGDFGRDLIKEHYQTADHH